MFLCPDLVNIFHKNTFDPYFILRSVNRWLLNNSFNAGEAVVLDQSSYFNKLVYIYRVDVHLDDACTTTEKVGN